MNLRESAGIVVALVVVGVVAGLLGGWLGGERAETLLEVRIQAAEQAMAARIGSAEDALRNENAASSLAFQQQIEARDAERRRLIEANTDKVAEVRGTIIAQQGVIQRFSDRLQLLIGEQSEVSRAIGRLEGLVEGSGSKGIRPRPAGLDEPGKPEAR